MSDRVVSLSNLIWRHNALQMGLAITLAVVAVPLWMLSFLMIQRMFSISLGPWVARAELYSYVVAAVGIVLLIFEARRRTGPLFDVMDYSTGGFRDATDIMQESAYGFRGSWGPLLGWMILQTMLCAPVSSVAAIRAWKSVFRTNRKAQEAALAVHKHLADTRRWAPVTDFAANIAGLALLDRLDLIWTEVQNDVVQVRVPAGEVPPTLVA